MTHFIERAEPSRRPAPLARCRVFDPVAGLDRRRRGDAQKKAASKTGPQLPMLRAQRLGQARCAACLRRMRGGIGGGGLIRPVQPGDPGIGGQTGNSSIGSGRIGLWTRKPTSRPSAGHTDRQQVEVARARRLEAMRLHEIGRNPLDAEDIAMFGCSSASDGATSAAVHILEQARQYAASQAAE